MLSMHHVRSHGSTQKVVCNQIIGAEQLCYWMVSKQPGKIHGVNGVNGQRKLWTLPNLCKVKKLQL